MIVKRLSLALPALALLAACGEEAPADDSRSASGEVLEGTISDAMLPVDRVRSEPPLEDPEAFAKARSAAEPGEAGEAPAANETEAGESEGAEPVGAEPADPPAADPAD